MSDTVSRLLAALEALERTIDHTARCQRLTMVRIPVIEKASSDCTCDYDVRRRLAIAQRTEAAIEAAVREAQGTTSTPIEPRVLNLAEDAIDVGVAAFASPGRDT